MSPLRDMPSTDLLSGLSEHHHVSSKRYVLVNLVEGVTHKRGVVDLQLRLQLLGKVRAHPFSGLSELHHVSSKR